MNNIRQRAAGLMALVAIIGIVIVLPLVLLAVGADPLPHTVPSWDTIRTALTSPDDGTLTLSVIKIIAWASWAFLSLSILLEVVSRIRGIHAPTLPGLRMPQSAARGLVGAAIMLFAASPVVAQAANAAPLPAHQVATASTHATVDTHTAKAEHKRSERAAAAKEARSPSAPTVKYTVQRGDSLWSIARDYLGSGQRYTEIAALNHQTLGDNPGFLKPGWVLQVPDESGPPAHEHVVTVKPGDTLSGIAEHELGDADQVPEIVAATAQTIQPGGAHLTNPNLIEPGWKIVIPGKTGAANHPKLSRPTGHATPHNPPRRHTPPASSAPAAPSAQPPATQPAQPLPVTPTPPAHVPSGDSTPRGNDVHQAAAAGVHQESTAPWMLTGLTGAGMVLAGGLWMALRRRRAAQFRARRPGKTIAVPPPELAAVEKTIVTVGAQAVPMVVQIDAILRHLAVQTQDDTMPSIAALKWTPEQTVLHLSDAATLPVPWTGTDDGLHWTMTAEAADGLVTGSDDEYDDRAAPLPMLVAIGSGDEGDVWLINLEDFGALNISGDVERGREFVRYLVAELAVNDWSEGVRVDCVGIADGLDQLDPARIRLHPDPERGDIAAELLADAIGTLEQAGGVDVTTARAHQHGDDAWQARVMIVDLAGRQPSKELRQVLELIESHPGLTGTAVLLNRSGASDDHLVEVELHIDADGRVSMPAVGLELAAVTLTQEEAQGCAQVFGQADEPDTDIPVAENAAGWHAFVNEAGALRDEYTLERTADADDAHSVLAGDDQEYVTLAATTPEDLAVLAPKIPDAVRDQLHETDPDLDADVEAWFSDDCARPRLSVLGPVSARTRGDAVAVAKRKAYYTELLAYLVTRPAGVTPAQLGEVFNIADGTVRRDVNTLREWLGTDPVTGQKYLPGAKESAAARERGMGVYQVSGVLFDGDLFRRLRARGEARGADGMQDLRRALTLVSGIPFDQLRTGGGAWLTEGDRLDHHMVCGIVDVAHMVTTEALRNGDVTTARAAAETAALAAPREEIPRLDLAAVAAAEGHNAEAERILRADVVNRSDDGLAPTELSERTETIIRNRDWLNPDKAAS